MTLVDLSKYDAPQEVDGLMMAFPANVVGTLLPRRKELPDEFQKDWRSNAYCNIAERWFFRGLERSLSFNAGIDAKKAMRHLKTCLGSFEPSHEEKIGGVGYLMSRWGAKEV
jgi:hypothetical protein